MNVFLLFCVPTITFLLIWHYLAIVHPARPLLFYPSSVLWGLCAIIPTMPFRGLVNFDGDFPAVFFGTWFNNAFLGPGVLLALFFWRHRKDPDQGVVLLRLTVWLASYFTFLSLSDFLTTTPAFGIPELFVEPLSWVLLIGLFPIFYLHFVASSRLSSRLVWAGASIGLGLGVCILVTLAFSPLAWVSWILTTGALVSTWWFLERFYAPLSAKRKNLGTLRYPTR